MSLSLPSLPYLNLWSTSVSIAIYPDRVVWLRYSAGLRKHVETKGMVQCAIDAELPWRAPMVLLPQVLAATGLRGGRVNVVLSNRLVRYALMPNPDSARNQHELALLARHVFQRTHGEVSAEWDIRLSDAAPGQTGLASAVDRELIALLDTSIAESGNKLVSIQPYLMAAFNRAACDKSLAVFVQAEPQRLCLLAQKEGGWVSVQQSHTTADWLQVLPESLERLAITADLGNLKTLLICAPEFTEPVNLPQLMSSKGWQLTKTALHWPAGLVPMQDYPFAGAMLAGQ